MKTSQKSKGETSTVESNEFTRKRKGDTVSLVIPKFNYKDTTIYTVNRQGTTLRTVYDKTGQVSNVDCFASAIEEMSRQNKQLFETYKEKSKEKTEEFDSSFILYIVAGIVLIVIIGFFFAFKYLSANSQAITTLINKIDGRTTS
jgi:cell division protein FtsL